MDLSILLKEENILLPLDVQTKEECIDKMADKMAKAGQEAGDNPPEEPRADFGCQHTPN